MKLNDLTNPFVFISTGFGIGMIPFAPGTFGSGLGLCLYIYFAHFYIPVLIEYVVILALFLIAWFAVDQTLKIHGEADHSEIVIDEIIGMIIVATILPPDPYWAIAAFLIFRFFDIAKPYPVNIIDRNYKNALGVILDDIVASIYSIILILIIMRLLG